MKIARKWCFDDTNSSGCECWQLVNTLDTLDEKSSRKVFLNWNDDWSVDNMILWINTNPDKEWLVHNLNGHAAALLPHVLLSVEHLNVKHLFLLRDTENLSREDRFEISTFLGHQSLRKFTANKGLRNLYRVWSFSIMLAPNDISDHHYSLLLKESNLVNKDEIPSKQKVWVDALNTLFEEKSATAVQLPSANKAQLSIPGILVSLKNKLFQKVHYKPKKVTSFFVDIDSLPPIKMLDPRHWNKVLITGWYGTETVGDKAILGEIIHQLRSYNPQLEIIISSIDLRVSWQTRIEMDLDVSHILIDDMYRSLKEHDYDAVIMGGGPLMESSKILPIARLFDLAGQQGINRVIFGCGVGPIHSDAMLNLISHIIQLSNVAFYRDQESLDFALRLGGDPRKSLLACDPATAFIRRWGAFNPSEKNLTRISTMLREQTSEYESKVNIAEQNEIFPSRISAVLKAISKDSDSMRELNLIPMHVYWRGNDDRMLNLKIAERIEGALEITPFLRYKGIYELIHSLNKSQIAIAMRYHGHIFSIALNIPFLSLDYTGKKGKVSNLMQRLDLQDFSVKFEDFRPEVLSHKLADFKAKLDFKEELKTKAETLTDKLEAAYKHFWN